MAELESALAERDARLAELQEQETARVAAEEAMAAAEIEHAHVLLVPAASGYTLVEREGPAPEARMFVEVGEDEWYVVTRVGPSPLPSGPRRCAFLARP
jgi:hypothetical protein